MYSDNSLNGVFVWEGVACELLVFWGGGFRGLDYGNCAPSHVTEMIGLYGTAIHAVLAILAVLATPAISSRLCSIYPMEQLVGFSRSTI